MYLQALASAFPETRHTQKKCWDIAATDNRLNGLNRRARKVLETVLTGESGIETRHFAIPAETLFALTAEDLNRAFEQEAPVLGQKALEKACAEACVAPSDIDALFLCTCTGYLCPGVSSHIAERTGMCENAFLFDITGLGCGAALPTMHAAQGFLASNPAALVATVAVEVCSAAFFLDDDAGVLVSACLFGDGAAAALWRQEGKKGQWKAGNFQSLHCPEEREKIRFVNSGGKLRNQLDRAVPRVAANAVGRLFARRTIDPDQIIAHPGGRDVIEAIETAIPSYRLTETREALRKFGNLSSPSVLVALQERFKGKFDDQRLWLTAFGAGFAAHSCELVRT